MQQIKVDGFDFDIYLKEEEIQSRINELALEVASKLNNQVPIMIGVLNGAIHFFNDFVHAYPNECKYDFMKIASYQKTNRGNVAMVSDIKEDIRNKPIIIIEDIVDTGHSLEFLMEKLQEYGPSSISVVSLLFKPGKFEGKYRPDYVGFDIDNEFVIGYGMDYDGLYRNLRNIYKAKK